MDLVRKLDRSMLKCVITWKQISFLMKIISPPSWMSLSMRCIRNPSTLNWPLLKLASIFVSVMRSMSNLPDSSQLLISWNLNPAILLAFMCPILVLARCFLASKSNELQVSNSESFSVSLVLDNLPLMSELLSFANGNCFNWSRQQGHVHVFTDCARIRSNSIIGFTLPHLMCSLRWHVSHSTARLFLAIVLSQAEHLGGPSPLRTIGVELSEKWMPNLKSALLVTRRNLFLIGEWNQHGVVAIGQ